MDWLKNFIVTKFLKRLLDKVPANNKKTILGIIGFVLSIIAQLYPNNPVSSVLSAILEMLQSMGATDYTKASLLLTAAGLVHKLLKWIDSK